MGDYRVLVRLSADYPRLRGRFQGVTNSFATNIIKYCYPMMSVRLACLIHAASVHPGPGSNPLSNPPKDGYRIESEQLEIYNSETSRLASARSKNKRFIVRVPTQGTFCLSRTIPMIFQCFILLV